MITIFLYISLILHIVLLCTIVKSRKVKITLFTYDLISQPGFTDILLFDNE